MPHASPPLLVYRLHISQISLRHLDAPGILIKDPLKIALLMCKKTMKPSPIEFDVR
jgi:hypothetical protein